jgi:uncharacterized protein (DUF2267 family)
MKNLGVFDKTLEKTGQWVESVAHEIGSTDHERSFQVLRAVLHALRDRLPPDEAVHLGAGLPMLLRGLYYESWHMGSKPEHYRHLEPFMEHIARDLPGLDRTQLERATTAVFSVMQERIGGGITQRVRHCLPEELRDFWPPPVVA